MSHIERPAVFTPTQNELPNKTNECLRNPSRVTTITKVLFSINYLGESGELEERGNMLDMVKEAEEKDNTRVTLGLRSIIAR